MDNLYNNLMEFFYEILWEIFTLELSFPSF